MVPRNQTAPRHLRRRWLLIALCVLVAALGALRLALPHMVLTYANGVLDQMPDYTGSVGDIDIHLWRGAYTIQDIRIDKRRNSMRIPFFESPSLDCSIDWRSLLHGQLRGQLKMFKPRLRFAQGASPDETQTGADQPWLSVINDLSPFRVDKAEVVDGEIHFHAEHRTPRVDVYLSEVNATVTNLTNVQNTVDPLMANVHARGRAMETGRFQFDMDLDPSAQRPTFDMAVRLLNVDVTRLNPLTMAYADFDFEGGQFDFVLEASARNGDLSGYVKPLFRHVRVLGPRDLKSKGPFRVIWEAAVGLTTELFKNQPRDQFGTRFAITGQLDNPKTNLLEVVGNTLRNAFIQA